MRQDSEWRPSHISHKGPPASPFPLIFPWRFIKRQPFERVHWFLGISSDKMHIPCRSSFNYPIWRPLIWSSRAGSVNRSVGHRGLSSESGESVFGKDTKAHTGTNVAPKQGHSLSALVWSLLTFAWKMMYPRKDTTELPAQCKICPNWLFATPLKARWK